MFEFFFKIIKQASAAPVPQPRMSRGETVAAMKRRELKKFAETSEGFHRAGRSVYLLRRI